MCLDIVAWEHEPQKNGRRIKDECIGYKLMRPFYRDGKCEGYGVPFKYDGKLYKINEPRTASGMQPGSRSFRRVPIALPYRFGFHCFLSVKDCETYMEDRAISWIGMNIVKVRMRRIEAAGWEYPIYNDNSIDLRLVIPCVVAKEITVLERVK